MNQKTETKTLSPLLVHMCCAAILLLSGRLQGQDNATVQFMAQWENHTLLTDTLLYSKTGDWFRFSSLRWYIHDLAILTQNGIRLSDSRKHRLIDIAPGKNEPIVFKLPEGDRPDSLMFTIGVDSMTQMAGALGQDLDPTQGMYWTWQSGYIHIKVEGTSSLSPSDRRDVALHLGGFCQPFSTIRRVCLPIKDYPTTMAVVLAVDDFVNRIRIAEHHHIMSPSEAGRQAAGHFAHSFRIMNPAK